LSAYFLDSSAVVKRYVAEAGTAWVSALCAPASGHELYAARVTVVEVVSAIVRRARSVPMLALSLPGLVARVRRELGVGFVVVELTPALADRAVALAEMHSLRGYDAVQLAAATEVSRLRQALGGSALTLVSADSELNAAAGVQGLPVEDPNTHA